MNPIIRKIMSLRKGDKINGGENVLPIRKINPLEKSRMEHKKMQELQNKIIGQRNNIGLTKGFAHDTRKRQFIRKGILGIIAGIGIAIFSKIAQAGGIKFYGEPDASIMNSSRGGALNIDITYVDRTATIHSSYNSQPVTKVGDATNNGRAWFNVYVPTNFTSLSRCELIGFPGQTGTLRWSISSKFGSDGEDKDLNTDSIAAADVAVTAEELQMLDLSAAFTGVAAGDVVALIFVREGSHANDTITDFNIMKIRFEYT